MSKVTKITVEKKGNRSIEIRKISYVEGEYKKLVPIHNSAYEEKRVFLHSSDRDNFFENVVNTFGLERAGNMFAVVIPKITTEEFFEMIDCALEIKTTSLAI